MRLAILLVVALASPAGADDDTSRARAHYEIGNGMYRLGDFHGALREFAAGYELTHKPGFLINLGQTYRKLHELTRARDMYREFLASTPVDDPARAQVRQLLADLEKELQSQPEPSPVPQVVVAPPVVVVAPATPPPKRRHRGLQIAGITLGIVGLGLVGGGAGSTALANDLAGQINKLDTFDPAKDDQYHLDRALAGALFGVGAAVAVAGIILLAVGSR